MDRTRMENQKVYSQNDEQRVILKALADLKVTQGKLLDIGAYAPEAFSNNRALIENDWEAVLVEPSPKPFAALLDAYANNPKITLVNAAVSSVKSALIPWYDSGGDAISTTNPAHKDKWEKGWKVNYKTFWIYVMPVQTLFETFGFEFDLINLDVESANLEIFRFLPWKALSKTKIICVEHDNNQNEMTQLAANYGFRPIGLNGENLILGRQ